MQMDSFQRKLHDVRRTIDEDNYRRRVLTLCQQTEPKSFEEYSSSGSFRKLEKFESSTYSEVLKAVDLADNNKPVVMKIMRALSKGVLKLLPALANKGCQSYNDILNELVVTQALSQLHDGVLLNNQQNSLYKTHFFCLIHEIKVVNGSMEKTLSRSKQEAENQQTTSETTKQAADNDINLVQSGRVSSQTRSRAKDSTKKPGQQTSDVAISEESQKSSGLSRLDTDIKELSIDSRHAPSFADARRQYEKDQDSIAETADATRPEEMVAEKNIDGASRVTLPQMVNNKFNVINTKNDDKDQAGIAQQQKELNKKDETKNQNDDDMIDDERMLMAALPNEYVVSVMRHDGQPLWWMMTHKKLTPEQLTSVLVQVIVGLAIAEHVYLYEHRDLHVSNILIKRTTAETLPFVVDGHHYQIVSHGAKATIIDATFSRLTHNGKVYFRDLTSTLRAYGSRKTPPKMSLQNRSYRQMVRLTNNKWSEFTPKTNLIWLTYLCETLMKNEVMKTNPNLTFEIRKIRDYTLKVKTTMDLLGCFPFEKSTSSTTRSHDHKTRISSQKSTTR